MKTIQVKFCITSCIIALFKNKWRRQLPPAPKLLCTLFLSTLIGLKMRKLSVQYNLNMNCRNKLFFLFIYLWQLQLVPSEYCIGRKCKAIEAIPCSVVNTKSCKKKIKLMFQPNQVCELLSQFSGSTEFWMNNMMQFVL